MKIDRLIAYCAAAVLLGDAWPLVPVSVRRRVVLCGLSVRVASRLAARATGQELASFTDRHGSVSRTALSGGRSASSLLRKREMLQHRRFFLQTFL
jgi:hypothetical protein